MGHGRKRRYAENARKKGQDDAGGYIFIPQKELPQVQNNPPEPIEVNDQVVAPLDETTYQELKKGINEAHAGLERIDTTNQELQSQADLLKGTAQSTLDDSVPMTAYGVPVGTFPQEISGSNLEQRVNEGDAIHPETILMESSPPQEYGPQEEVAPEELTLSLTPEDDRLQEANPVYLPSLAETDETPVPETTEEIEEAPAVYLIDDPQNENETPITEELESPEGLGPADSQVIEAIGEDIEREQDTGYPSHPDLASMLNDPRNEPLNDLFGTEGAQPQATRYSTRQAPQQPRKKLRYHSKLKDYLIIGTLTAIAAAALWVIYKLPSDNPTAGTAKPKTSYVTPVRSKPATLEAKSAYDPNTSPAAIAAPKRSLEPIASSSPAPVSVKKSPAPSYMIPDHKPADKVYKGKDIPKLKIGSSEYIFTRIEDSNAINISNPQYKGRRILGYAPIRISDASKETDPVRRTVEYVPNTKEVLAQELRANGVTLGKKEKFELYFFDNNPTPVFIHEVDNNGVSKGEADKYLVVIKNPILVEKNDGTRECRPKNPGDIYVSVPTAN
jgi:hypothetical protein